MSATAARAKQLESFKQQDWFKLLVNRKARRQQSLHFGQAQFSG